MTPAPISPPARRYAPTATYRLQMHAGFTFADAAAIAPTLRRLGVSHAYCSPILAARPGSTHGYDITDHRALNPELGGTEGFAAFSHALEAQDLGLIIDIVPNHMGINGADNGWWLSVLEWGQDSPHADYFDIDWFPATEGLTRRVLLPVLGDLYGRVLANGNLRLAFEPADGSFSVWYYDHRFPVCPGSYIRILEPLLGDDPDCAALLTEARHLRAMPRSHSRRKGRVTRGEHFKERLAAEDALHGRLNSAQHLFAETAEDGRGLERLHALIEAQAWRPAYWRLSSHEINYRRFFQINDLAGLRVEDPAVFDAAHRLVHDLVAAGRVHGLRIDHIDGLADPKGYLDRLQSLLAPHADRLGFPAGAFPVWVEKILEGEEPLRSAWACAGTTGYDALAEILAAQVDPAGLSALETAFATSTGTADAEAEGVRARRQIMDQELAAELAVLANQVSALLKRDRNTRDFARADVRAGLREIIAHFPVYRTYIDADGPTAEDDIALGRALRGARKARAVGHGMLYDVLAEVLSGRWQARADGRPRAGVLALVRRMQQLTGPVTAKGLEDTTFYRVLPLTALNEVGSAPNGPPLSPEAFHRRMARRARDWPGAMVTTATHDTKRSEDVRARLAVLSECPDDWTERAARWAAWTRPIPPDPDEDNPDSLPPSAADTWLTFQTLAGIWPAHDPAAPFDPEGLPLDALAGRLETYLLKAAREAKLHTSWLDNDAAYEAGLSAFARDLLTGPSASRFLPDLDAFVAAIAPAGAVNALAQVVLRLTMPGLPDTYQGTELWDDSLVDPDNRRPVDWPLRSALLDEAESDHLADDPADLMGHWRDGRVKLAIIRRLLALRRALPDLARAGSYEPLTVRGQRAGHVIAFARRWQDTALVVAVPRLPLALIRQGAGDGILPLGRGVWGETVIDWDGPPLIDRLGDLPRRQGPALECAGLFARLPVAVLSGE